MLTFVGTVIAFVVFFALAYVFKSPAYDRPWRYTLRNTFAAASGAGAATTVIVLLAAATIPGVGLTGLSIWAVIVPLIAVAAGVVLARLLRDPRDTTPWHNVLRKMSTSGAGTLIGSLLALLILLAVYGADAPSNKGAGK